MSSNLGFSEVNRALDESTLSLPGKRAHNNKQPINRLPDQLLERIFMVTTESTIRPRGAYRFTLFPDVAIEVCSQWMRVALASPRLWTHLHIREHLDDDDIALWVSRAGKDTLLDIEIDILEPYCGVARFGITNWAKQAYHIARIFKFLCSINAGPHRWRSLSLSILQPEPLYKLIQLLNQQPAPNLRYLYLCSEPDGSDHRFNEDRAMTKAHYGQAYSLSEHAVANLRHAEFIYVSWKYVFDRPKPLFSGLTSLSLSSGLWVPLLVLPHIQQLLSANPNLESLQLSVGSATPDYESERLPDDQRPNPVHLSSLRSLSLEGGENITFLGDILAIISAPSLERLTLSNHGLDIPDEVAASITDYIITGQLPGSDSSTTSATKPLFPHLRELDIAGLPFEDQKIADILSSSPLVTRLSIVCYHAKPCMDMAPHALPRLEVLSLECSREHEHSKEIADILTRRASDDVPIRVLEISACSPPEPGFEERFPGTVLRLRKV